jgi:hypothetical protein
MSAVYNIISLLFATILFFPFYIPCYLFGQAWFWIVAGWKNGQHDNFLNWRD